MDLNTEKLIKLLPFDEEFKTTLLAELPSMTPDQRFTLERAVWGLYDAISMLLLDKKIALALHDEKGLKLDRDFYKKARAEVEQEMLHLQESTLAHIDLSATREQLQEMTQNSSN